MQNPALGFAQDVDPYKVCFSPLRICELTDKSKFT